MRKITLLILCLIIVSYSAQADMSWKASTKIGLKGNANYYLSFLDDEDAEGQFSPGFGGFIEYQLTNYFALNLSAGYDQVNMTYSNAGDINNHLINGILRGKIFLLGTNSISPFLNLGIGAFSHTQSNGFSGTKYAGLGLAGLGVEIPLSNRINLVSEINAVSTIRNDLDAPPNKTDLIDDQFVNASLGISIQLGGPEKKAPRVEEQQIVEEVTPISRDSLERLKEKIEAKKQQLKEYKEVEKEYGNKINALIHLIENKNEIIDSLHKAESKMEKQEPQESKQKPTSDLREVYNTGQYLFSKREYEKAAEKFKSLYDKYPDHKLVSNFAYWAGESYYGLGDYENSLKYFNIVREYPESPKNDDALIMAGQSLLKLNRNEEAKDIFRELLEKYPDSEYSKLAEKFIETK